MRVPTDMQILSAAETDVHAELPLAGVRGFASTTSCALKAALTMNADLTGH
jgi:hypothetical protein